MRLSGARVLVTMATALVARLGRPDGAGTLNGGPRGRNQVSTPRRGGDYIVKKLLAVAAIAAAALLLVRRQRSAKAEADLSEWMIPTRF